MEKSSLTRLLIAMGLAITVVMAVACSACGSGEGGGITGEEAVGLRPFPGSGVEGRQLLGLCSHNVENDLKARAPASQWPDVRNIRLNIPWGAIEKKAKVNSPGTTPTAG